MGTTLMIIGGLILLGGFGLLKQGRGGKMTQQGCSTVVMGCLLLIIGLVIASVTDNPEKDITLTTDDVTTVISTSDTSNCTLGAVFQEDISIPDNTQLYAGKQFTKTWRIHNSGTCNWEEGYRLKFIDGDQMSDSESHPLPKVSAGEEANISIGLVVPDEAGTYRGNWQVCVNEANCFGDILYVKIISVSK